MSVTVRKDQALPEHSIRITMEGPDTEQGHVPVGIFVQTIERVASMLRHLDRKVGDDRKESFYLRVVGLSHDSPASVVLQQCLVSPKVDRRDLVARRLVEVMASIESDSDGSIYDYELLDKASELSAPVGRDLRTLCVSTNGTTYDVDLGFRDRLAKKLAPEQKSYGSIRGMLEYINIHGKQHVFRIYPDAGPSKLACVFGDDILADARAAVGKFVEARGQLKYKAIARYPHEMIVSKLDILPGGGAERLIAARGLLPDLTGELTTEEYMAHVRSNEDE